MTVKQEIFRVRRNYNKWVNNQTLEDYALRFTAKASRKWSLGRVALTALGSISFLALEAIGGAITLVYGFPNTLYAVIAVSLIIFLCAIPICYYAAQYGVDIDLLTRGAGFGYIGSTTTSLIYASFTFIFFALEAAIMAKALELVFAIPLELGYILSSVVVIPLVFYGITFISRFQMWTQPFWLFLQILPFIFIIYLEVKTISNWTTYSPEEIESGANFDVILFGGAAAVLFSLIGQIGEQVDFLRFLPPRNKTNNKSWWAALLGAGPGWIILGALKILIGSFLAFLALQQGIAEEDADDPAKMYQIAFSYLSNNEYVVLSLVGIFVVLSQLKINVTNAYAGSIAWSNFFSRLTRSHPGRVVWLVFNVAIALLLMELGVYQAFENTLTIYALVAVAWVGSLVADLVINKPLGLSPPYIEFKRAYLHDINPVGVSSMLIATIVGIIAYVGILGETCKALAHFLTLGTPFVTVPAIALLTRSRYYLAREKDKFAETQNDIPCCICENHYESEDMAYCPAYGGAICSLCCSLDARCQDQCKEQSSPTENFIELLRRTLPKAASPYINSRLIKFSFLLIAVASICGALLSVVYSHTVTSAASYNELLSDTLWKVFFILMIVSGVICWLFILAHESRIVAQEESQTQTLRLVKEIEAHEITDRKLQDAKESAEAANNAKSRYLTGISHELRTPLNTILGYAQLLEKDHEINRRVQHQVAVIRRSGEHLADLIEGLLDISKIEAGRLDIYRDRIRFKALLEQLVDMFRPQAEAKKLAFELKIQSKLPEFVQGDEKRVRQILINLLSNAINYTRTGKVIFTIRYRNHVAEFKVIDTGVGISEADIERIFRPFERVRTPGVPSIGGTGLGLTISRLLCDIMGGDLSVQRNNYGGATFMVSLMLARLPGEENEYSVIKRIYGYKGTRKTVLVVDDDATHRGLLSDLLSPLGFTVLEAQDAASCEAMLEHCIPDIYFLDCLMPGKDGLTLADDLRTQGIRAPIVIVSANAFAEESKQVGEQVYDAYLNKPIKLETLLQLIGNLLSLEWEYKSTSPNHQSDIPITNKSFLPDSHWQQRIIEYASSGNLSGLRDILNQLNEDPGVNEEFIKHLQNLVQKVRFEEIVDLFGGIK